MAGEATGDDTGDTRPPGAAGRAGATRPALGARGRAGVVVAYALVTFGSFPHPLGALEIDLGTWLAWLSPALLMLAVWGLAPLRAARVGLVAGWLAHGLVLHWIYVVTVRYGGAPPVVGVVAPLLLASYMAAATAVFCAAFAALLRGGRLPLFAGAAAWVLVDQGRHVVLTGFPWAVIGYAQHRNPALMGLAPLAGVLGLSFAVALGGAALAGLAMRGRALRREALCALGAVAVLHAAGLVSALRTRDDAGETLRVAVLQGNIDQGQKWSPDRVAANTAVYRDLTRAAAAEGAQLVVWPETAVAAPVETIPSVRRSLEALAQETGAALVVGAVGMERGERFDPAPPTIFDSALVFSGSGDLVARYDKTKLVPFGEYLPLRALLGRFVRAIARGSAGIDVTPGERVRATPIPVSGAAGGVLLAGIPICYELIFPDRVRRFVDDGGGLLLGITNDAWYGRTGAPLQFLAMSAMRAAENGVWMARAANTGVSAFVDRRGRVRERSGLFERGYLLAEVPVLPAEAPRTFYTRNGNWIVILCGLLVAGIGGLSAYSNPHRDPAPAPGGPSPAGALDEGDAGRARRREEEAR